MSRTSLPYVLFLLATALSFPLAADAQPTAPSTTPAPRTALQLHVDFFDRNGDGIIHASETARGLKAIGLPGGSAGAWVTAQAIHAGLPKTHGGGSWYRPTSIDTSIIHRGVHGSDTGAYDDDGNYVHPKYLAIFQYDADGNDAIDSEEMKAFHAGKKTATGSAATKAEFTVLMLVAAEVNPTNGLKQLTRETLRSLYDGSLFHKLEAKVTAEREEAARKRAEARKGFMDRLSNLWPF
jgi:peroxygenase